MIDLEKVIKPEVWPEEDCKHEEIREVIAADDPLFRQRYQCKNCDMKFIVYEGRLVRDFRMLKTEE